MDINTSRPSFGGSWTCKLNPDGGVAWARGAGRTWYHSVPINYNTVECRRQSSDQVSSGSTEGVVLSLKGRGEVDHGWGMNSIKSPKGGSLSVGTRETCAPALEVPADLDT